MLPGRLKTSIQHATPKKHDCRFLVVSSGEQDGFETGTPLVSRLLRRPIAFSGLGGWGKGPLWRVIYTVEGETRERTVQGEMLGQEVVKAGRGRDEIDEEAARAPPLSVEWDEREMECVRAELLWRRDAGDEGEGDVGVPMDADETLCIETMRTTRPPAQREVFVISSDGLTLASPTFPELHSSASPVTGDIVVARYRRGCSGIDRLRASPDTDPGLKSRIGYDLELGAEVDVRVRFDVKVTFRLRDLLGLWLLDLSLLASHSQNAKALKVRDFEGTN